MKKILIVEDTQTNLEAAKSFFAGIVDYKFTFVTNVERARLMLSGVDAVIMDRSLPCTDEDTAADYHNFEDPNADYGYVMQAHGYRLLAQAVVKNIPVVMFSSHGDSTFCITTDDFDGCAKILEEYENPDVYDANKCLDFRRSMRAVKLIGTGYENIIHDLPKDKPSSWETPWRRLLERMG